MRPGAKLGLLLMEAGIGLLIPVTRAVPVQNKWARSMFSLVKLGCVDSGLALRGLEGWQVKKKLRIVRRYCRIFVPHGVICSHRFALQEPFHVANGTFAQRLDVVATLEHTHRTAVAALYQFASHPLKIF